MYLCWTAVHSVALNQLEFLLDAVIGVYLLGKVCVCVCVCVGVGVGVYVCVSCICVCIYMCVYFVGEKNGRETAKERET